MSQPVTTKPPANAKPPAASPAASSMQPTRQLLDELDSLMQRMLALPVNQLEDEIRASEERSNQSYPSEEEEQPLYRRLAVDDLQQPTDYSQPETGNETDAAPSLADPAGDIPLPPSLLLTAPALPQQEEKLPEEREPELKHEPPPAPVPEEDTAATESPASWESSLPASPEVLAAISERSRMEVENSSLGRNISLPERSNASVPEPVVAGWLRPLLWCNHVFDHVTGWLGEPGEWLRSHRGRALLGWSGLGLLAGALAWALVAGFGGSQ